MKIEQKMIIATKINIVALLAFPFERERSWIGSRFSEDPRSGGLGMGPGGELPLDRRKSSVIL
jgi:hypothetical protein